MGATWEETRVVPATKLGAKPMPPAANKLDFSQDLLLIHPNTTPWRIFMRD